jgi:hypothetical protein
MIILIYKKEIHLIFRYIFIFTPNNNANANNLGRNSNIKQHAFLIIIFVAFK